MTEACSTNQCLLRALTELQSDIAILKVHNSQRILIDAHNSGDMAWMITSTALVLFIIYHILVLLVYYSTSTIALRGSVSLRQAETRSYFLQRPHERRTSCRSDRVFVSLSLYAYIE